MKGTNTNTGSVINLSETPSYPVKVGISDNKIQELRKNGFESPQSIVQEILKDKNVASINIRNFFKCEVDFIKALIEHSSKPKKFEVNLDQMALFQNIPDIISLRLKRKTLIINTENACEYLLHTKQTITSSGIKSFVVDTNIKIVLSKLIELQNGVVSFLNDSNMIEILTDEANALHHENGKKKTYKKYGIFCYLALQYISFVNDANEIRIDTLPKDQITQNIENIITFFFNCLAKVKLMLSDELYLERVKKEGKLKDDTVELSLDASKNPYDIKNTVKKYKDYLKDVKIININNAENVEKGEQESIIKCLFEGCPEATITFGIFSISHAPMKVNSFTEITQENAVYQLFYEKSSDVKLKDFISQYKGFLGIATILKVDSFKDKSYEIIVKALPKIEYVQNQKGTMKVAHKIKVSFFDRWINPFKSNTQNHQPESDVADGGDMLPTIVEEFSTDSPQSHASQQKKPPLPLNTHHGSRRSCRHDRRSGRNLDGYQTDGGYGGDVNNQSGYTSEVPGSSSDRRGGGRGCETDSELLRNSGNTSGRSKSFLGSIRRKKQTKETFPSNVRRATAEQVKKMPVLAERI